MREPGCKLKYLMRLATACLLWVSVSTAWANPPEVPRGRDLHADGQVAAARTLPILLSFSTRDCGYCQLLEEDFLKPMLLSGLYENKILIRKVLIDEGQTLVDFDGRAVDADRMASRYRVHAVPTVVFVDAHGHELAERMVGINTVEFYGGYLDQNIDTALTQVRQQPAH